MQKITIPVVIAAAAVVLIAVIISTVFQPLGMPNPKPVASKRAGAARHNISNIVIQVDGNKAKSVSYWFHYSNDNPERRGVFDGFGHYEDELIKTNGKWLFTKRKIYNEGRDEWAYKGVKNPAC